MINGATATVVNEADSRLFYKTFDGKFIPYLIEGEGGGDLSDYTGENVSIKVNNEFITTSNKNLFLRAKPADKDDYESCYIDMKGELNDGYGYMAVRK